MTPTQHRTIAEQVELEHGISEPSQSAGNCCSIVQPNVAIIDVIKSRIYGFRFVTLPISTPPMDTGLLQRSKKWRDGKLA